MSCIHDLVRNQDTYRADVEQTVLAVAQAMVERNIGAVPVLRDGFLAGVFSERDLMRRVVVEGLLTVRPGLVVHPVPYQEKASSGEPKKAG